MNINNNGVAEGNGVKLDIMLSSPLPAGVKLEIFKNGILLNEVATGPAGTLFSYTDVGSYGAHSYTAKCSTSTKSKSGLGFNLTLIRPSGGVQITPTAPNLTAVTNANSITLNWNAVAGAISYKIYRDGVFLTSRLASLPPTYSISGTNDSTLYTFQVTAIGAGNLESPRSNTFTKSPSTTTIINNAITAFTIVSAGINYNQFESIPVFADGVQVGLANGPNLAPLIAVQIINPGAGLLDGTYTWNGANPAGRVVVTGGSVTSTIIDNAGTAFSGPIGPITVNVQTDPAFVGSTVFPSLLAIQGGPIIGAGPTGGVNSISYPAGYTPTITVVSNSVSNGSGAILAPVMGQLTFGGPPPVVVYETVDISPATIAVDDSITISLSGGTPNTQFSYTGRAIGSVVGGAGVLQGGTGTFDSSGNFSFTVTPVTYATWVGGQSMSYRYDFSFDAGRQSRADFNVIDYNYVAPPAGGYQIGDLVPDRGRVIAINVFGLIFGPIGTGSTPNRKFNVQTGVVENPIGTLPVSPAGNVYFNLQDLVYSGEDYVPTQAELDKNIAFVAARLQNLRSYFPPGAIIVTDGNGSTGGGVFVSAATIQASLDILIAQNGWEIPVW